MTVLDLDTVPAGTRRNLELPIGTLPDHTPLSMRIEVVRGDAEGPTLFLSGCIHGDELNGFEIIRRVVDKVAPQGLRGTIISAPIINVFGFLQKQRYLPDRRDLNRVFPGRARGSQASRLAHDVVHELLVKCTHGVDLHTGPIARFNYPQIRGDFGDSELHQMAQAFGTPVGFHSRPREGTIRRAAGDVGVKMLLYEGGEALRFDRGAIRHGVDGVLRVMKFLGMIDDAPEPVMPMREATRTRWIRARTSGVLRLVRESGEFVEKNEIVGHIGDALADRTQPVKSPTSGLLISHVTGPLVSEGDAIFRVASLAK